MNSQNLLPALMLGAGLGVQALIPGTVFVIGGANGTAACANDGVVYRWPNRSLRRTIGIIDELHAHMAFTSGEDTLETIWNARSGEMYDVTPCT